MKGENNMALTGLDIYKRLPKTNCKACGLPTCLAFAMSLAGSKTSLEKCPYVSEEAKEFLGGASAPPIKLIKVGTGNKIVELGDETVLFRHDKTFYHPTSIAIEIMDTLDAHALREKIDKINDLKFERVGQHIEVDMIAVRNVSGDADTFAASATAIANGSELALILISEEPQAMEKALAAVAHKIPLIYAATADNYEKMVELARKYKCPLVVKGEGLVATADLSEKIGASYKELVIDTGSRTTSHALADMTQCRRLSIKKRFRPLGYPTIAFAQGETPMDEIIQAGMFVAKYSSIIVLKTDEKALILPLLTLRMNIYTDPQKPIQVEPKYYEIGAVTPDSPVYLTTNFSLTYYTVEGEVAGSKIPSYILAVNTDGTSVLTAWAAGKFNGEKIAEFIKQCGIEEKVNHRNIVIPGFAAVISGALKEKSGWNVIVGPQEASGIPVFAKINFSK